MTSDKKKIIVVATSICDGNLVLVGRRSENQGLAGLWEFPGGKVEEGETHKEALIREIKEELGCGIVVGKFIGRSVVSMETKSIEMHLYASVISYGSPVNLEHEELRWISVEEFNCLEWAPADVPLLAPLENYLMGQDR